ncbi:hypothetical protein [Nonomuraea sp. NPDC049725]|uniref:hypothetical protein n=1 Tax=Nonomuraea sp. NPDC049725 TaxID=3154508 RepID=UPI0034331CE6
MPVFFVIRFLGDHEDTETAAAGNPPCLGTSVARLQYGGGQLVVEFGVGLAGGRLTDLLLADNEAAATAPAPTRRPADDESRIGIHLPVGSHCRVRLGLISAGPDQL